MENTSVLSDCFILNIKERKEKKEKNITSVDVIFVLLNNWVILICFCSVTRFVFRIKMTHYLKQTKLC